MDSSKRGRGVASVRSYPCRPHGAGTRPLSDVGGVLICASQIFVAFRNGGFPQAVYVYRGQRAGPFELPVW